MSDRESPKGYDLGGDESPRVAAPRSRSTIVKDGAVLALIGALILAGLGYWLFLDQTARFVAPVACRGEHSAAYEVDQPVSNVGGRRLQDAYLSCLSEDGSRRPVGGLLIYTTLAVEAFVALFLLYLFAVSGSLRGRPGKA